MTEPILGVPLGQPTPIEVARGAGYPIEALEQGQPNRRLLFAFGPAKAKDLPGELQKALAKAGVEPGFPENQLLSPELRAQLTKKLTGDESRAIRGE